MNILIRSVRHWQSHNAPRMGAALSYYAMLSFVPLIILVISAAALLFSKDTVELALMHQLVTTVGSNASLYISEILHNTPLQDISFGAAMVSATIFLIGAIGVFSELDRDLDELWDVTPTAKKTHVSVIHKISAYLHGKIAVLAFIPLLALLLAVSIGLTFFMSIVQSTITMLAPLSILVPLLQFIAPLVLSTLLFTVMYRVLPNRKLPWKTLIVGALVTALLFMVGNILITQYIKLLVHTDIFGGASSLVGLLVWSYYSAQVFFLGASFTYIYAQYKGVTASREIGL
jgi:membrane protein